MADEFSERYGDLLTGSYDCVDRIVLNAYFPMGHDPGGFRVWWRRLHDDSDEAAGQHPPDADGGPVRPPGAGVGRRRTSVPVIDCKSGERKHRIAEEYLRRAPRRAGGVPDPGGAGTGDGVGRPPVRRAG